MPSTTFEGVVTYCTEVTSRSTGQVRQKNFSLDGEGIKFFIAFRDKVGFDLIKNGTRLKVWIRPGSSRLHPDNIRREIITRAILADTGKALAVETSVEPDWEQADLF